MLEEPSTTTTAATTNVADESLAAADTTTTTTITDDEAELLQKAMDDAAAEIDNAAAAADADAEDNNNNTNNNDEQQHTSNNTNNEPRTIKGMLNMFRKHSQGTNAIQESIKTFSNPDGSDQKGDLLVHDNKDEALAKLMELIELDKVHLTQTNKKRKKKLAAEKWNFKSSPHEEFGKTMEDTYMAFLQWSKTIQKEESATNNNNDETTTTTTTTTTTIIYNVSKAFRRLVSYAEWMEDAEQDLMDPPLIADATLKKALDAWAMKCSIDTIHRQFLWWFDFGRIDREAIKSSISLKDSLRAFVWYAHYIMYDPFAQENGIVFMENADQITFMNAMTLMPMKLGIKLDRLTIGILPIKMKAIYILNTPTWMDMFMKFMSMFMSKKMQERMILLKDDEWNKVEEIVGGKEAIPKVFGPLRCGLLDMDPMEKAFFSA